MKQTHEYWLDRLGLHATLTQRLAMRYLESKGLRFLIDFGTENAIDKADVLVEEAMV